MEEKKTNGRRRDEVGSSRLGLASEPRATRTTRTRCSTCSRVRRSRSSTPEGLPLGAFEARTADIFSFRCVGDELVSTDDKGLRAPATHIARNAGSRRYREILIEKKT